MAQSYAYYLAEFNLFQHSNFNDLGENLALSWSFYTPDTSNCSSIIPVHIIKL